MRRLQSFPSWLGIVSFSNSSASVPAVFIISSSSASDKPDLKQGGVGGWVACCFKKPSFCFPPWSGIRRAGAEDPGRCPGPVGSSSGLHQNPAGQPRGTASCPRSWSPETRPHAALTRSQRWAYPVRSVKSVKISLTRNVCLFVSRTITNIQKGCQNWIVCSCISRIILWHLSLYFDVKHIRFKLKLRSSLTSLLDLR